MTLVPTTTVIKCTNKGINIVNAFGFYYCYRVVIYILAAQKTIYGLVIFSHVTCTYVRYFSHTFGNIEVNVSACQDIGLFRYK